MKKYPKFLKSLLTLTIHDEKIPTDLELDNKIEELNFYLHIVWPLTLHILRKKVWFFFRYYWKVILRKTVTTGMLLTAVYFAWIKVAKPIFIVRERTEFVNEIHKELMKSAVPEENLRFMTSISMFESRNNYGIVNGQYWGAFQIGDVARKEIGLSCMTPEIFCHDIELQNWAMNKIMQKNYEYLYPTIEKYKIPMKGGILVGNNLVTVSGLIAGAHLVGASAAIQFVESDGKEIVEDGNHVPITKYLQLNGYELKFNR